MIIDRGLSTGLNAKVLVTEESAVLVWGLEHVPKGNLSLEHILQTILPCYMMVHLLRRAGSHHPCDITN